jgi:hypothetical protein
MQEWQLKMSAAVLGLEGVPTVFEWSVHGFAGTEEEQRVKVSQIVAKCDKKPTSALMRALTFHHTYHVLESDLPKKKSDLIRDGNDYRISTQEVAKAASENVFLQDVRKKSW